MPAAREQRVSEELAGRVDSQRPVEGAVKLGRRGHDRVRAGARAQAVVKLVLQAVVGECTGEQAGTTDRRLRLKPTGAPSEVCSG